MHKLIESLIFVYPKQMMSMFILASVVIIITHGFASQQNERTKYSDTFLNISEIPMQQNSMNLTGWECECKIFRHESNQFLALLLGFVAGFLTAGTIAGMSIMRLKLKELQRRQKEEDIIMNIIEWNEMRKRVIQRTQELEHDKEIQTEDEIVNNQELETIHNNSAVSLESI